MVQARSRRHGFNPTSVNVGFVLDKVAHEQACFPRVLRFSFVGFHPPLLHTHSCIADAVISAVGSVVK